MQKIGVFFVCLGNICRSPMAKGLFLAKVKERGLSERFDVASGGTSGYHVGEPPDPGAIRAARAAGIDLSRDRSHQATRADLQSYDYILACDRTNRRDLVRLAPELAHKVRLLREFGPSPGDLDVPDPWGEGERSFQRSFDIIDEAAEGLLEHILREHPELGGATR
jgi:protein-tyrosine phosphatase